MTAWEQIFAKMASGKTPYKKFYIQSGGSGDITYISPTEQSRLQAQSILKRQIVDQAKNISNSPIKKKQIIIELKKKVSAKKKLIKKKKTKNSPSKVNKTKKKKIIKKRKY